MLKGLVKISIKTLKVFTNGYDTYVAYDLEDVEKSYFETVGEWRDKDDVERLPFYQIPLFRKLIIEYEDEIKKYPLFAEFFYPGQRPGMEWEVKAPAWAWILCNGRGFLCSDEY